MGKINFILIMILSALIARGESFVVDELIYEITSAEERTVSLTGTTAKIYKGKYPEEELLSEYNVVVPEYVVNDGIEYAVTAIGRIAFSYTTLKSIVSSGSIRSIEHSAFAFSDLEEFVGFENLKVIGDYALRYTKLEEFVYPKSLEHIGIYILHSPYLKRVIIPEGTIFPLLPEDKYNITSIFGTTTEEIICYCKTPQDLPEKAFYKTGVDIDGPVLDNTLIRVPKESVEAYRNAPGWSYRSNNIYSLDYNLDDPQLFKVDGLYYTVNDESSKSVSLTRLIYESLKSEEHPYEEWTVVEVPQSVTLNGIDYTVTEIGSGVFRRASVEEIHLPPTIHTVGQVAFERSSLRKIITDATIMNYGCYAFYNTSIEEYSIPEGVESLDQSYFMLGACLELRKVTFPSTLRELTARPQYTFGYGLPIGGSMNVDSLICYAVEPPKAIPDDFGYDQWDIVDGHKVPDSRFEMDPVVYVPRGSAEAYRSAPGWCRLSRFEEIEVPVSVSGEVADREIGFGIDMVSSGRLQLRSPGDEVVSISDPSGRIVWRGIPPSDRYELSLPSGFYIVRCGNSVLKTVVR